jgi:glycosyltransferase involved in cell wall biosynthesis
VGEPISPPYLASMQAFADAVAPGAVRFESGLSGAELAARWHAAAVFVCASEHEGFCIPLLEAFHFGVPVVARAFGGIGEVAGDAALLLSPEDDLATFAEAAHLAATDHAVRAELVSRGRARLDAFAFDATAAKLRAALESG